MKPTFWAIEMCVWLLAVPAVAAPPSTGAIPIDASSMPPAATPNLSCGEGRYCFDAQAPWIHGYFQELPAAAGFHVFRPYNYKHVLVQSQMAAEWGLPSTAPYSQQFERGTRGSGSTR